MAPIFGTTFILYSMVLFICVYSEVLVSTQNESKVDPNVIFFDGFTETPNRMVEMEASEALGAVVMEKLDADTDKNFPKSCFQQCTQKTTCDLVIIWTETNQCVLMSCRPADQTVCQFANEGAIGFKMFLKNSYELETSETTTDPISFPEAEYGQNGIDFEDDPEDSKKVPVCEQPKRVGPCRAAFPRFFFNKATLTCEPFIYGGCRPNDNNFKTKEECLATCSQNKPKPEKSEKVANEEQVKEDIEVERKENIQNVPICEQPKEVGICKASLRRFYFNQKTKLCENFIYGGCKGNKNNFKTEEDCVAACVENVLTVTETSHESSNETVSLNVDPFHSAHRQTFGHEGERGMQMMSATYQLEAVVPLIVGALISMAMLILVIYRCHVNRQTGPKRLHKIVYDGPPPTVGELHSDDEVVNGMYT